MTKLCRGGIRPGGLYGNQSSQSPIDSAKATLDRMQSKVLRHMARDAILQCGIPLAPHSSNSPSKKMKIAYTEFKIQKNASIVRGRRRIGEG